MAVNPAMEPGLQNLFAAVITMCGIAGKLIFDPVARVERHEILSMLSPIRHRGPDGEDVYLDGNVGLGHCRLSIIDIDTGAQPMANEDKSVWIVFNGEIYNFEELRDRLISRGHAFRSRCDTEVIIHLYEDFGPQCVTELQGMFAFAIWDCKLRRLFLARDRVGIKPLYFSQAPKALYFASELKAIIADPSIPLEVHLPAIRKFLSFNYVPGHETLLCGIHKLLPGHYLLAKGRQIERQQYWDLRFTRTRWNIPFEAASEELHSLLASTVRHHMVADVPVGVLLSGGLDSSAVLSFAVQGADKQVASFTVGFNGSGVVDERPYARLAAERFGTLHYETTITATDFWNFLPAYIWHMEEPVCEPPAVALFYITKLARSHVKVLLSGEGGDEAFAGYPNYGKMLMLQRLGTLLGPLRGAVRGTVCALGKVTGDPRLQRYGWALGKPLSEHYFSRTSSPATMLNGVAERLFSPDFNHASMSFRASDYIASLSGAVRDEPLLNQMLYIDSKTWLPDDLLVKADKITMANSIELRVPLLDHSVLEFAASLPMEFKVRGKETKRVLKNAFARSVPSEVIQRKKAGFPVPYEIWLDNELRLPVRDIILSERAASRGYFKREELDALLKLNLRRHGNAKVIFSLLVLEMWHQTFVDK